MLSKGPPHAAKPGEKDGLRCHGRWADIEADSTEIPSKSGFTDQIVFARHEGMFHAGIGEMAHGLRQEGMRFKAICLSTFAETFDVSTTS